MTDKDTGGNVPTDLESSAALLRFDLEDLDALLRSLVERLSSVPGLKVVVNYGNGRIRRLLGDIPYFNDLYRPSDPIRRMQSDPVRRMMVTIGSSEYWVESTHGSLACGVDRLTRQRGQVTDSLPFAVWADLLLDEISSQTHMSHESAVALRNLIEGERA